MITGSLILDKMRKAGILLGNFTDLNLGFTLGKLTVVLYKGNLGIAVVGFSSNCR